MPTYVVLSANSSSGSRLPARGFYVANGNGDYPPSTLYANKTITGHVYDTGAAPVVGATVDLYRQIDGKKVAVTTSGAGGVYSFVRGANDPYLYFTVAWSLAGGSIQVHGTSNLGLVPA